jgi:hypothetical protein
MESGKPKPSRIPEQGGSRGYYIPDGSEGKLRHEDTTNANAAGAGKSNAAGRVDLGLCRALSFVLLALS